MPINVQRVPPANFYGSIVVTSIGPSLNLDCNGKIFRYEGAGNITITVPSNLPLGFNCGFAMWGTGTVTLAAGSGATNRSAKTVLSAQYGSGSIFVMKNPGAAAEFLVGGDFT